MFKSMSSRALSIARRFNKFDQVNYPESYGHFCTTYTPTFDSSTILYDRDHGTKRSYPVGRACYLEGTYGALWCPESRC